MFCFFKIATYFCQKNNVLYRWVWRPNNTYFSESPFTGNISKIWSLFYQQYLQDFDKFPQNFLKFPQNFLNYLKITSISSKLPQNFLNCRKISSFGRIKKLGKNSRWAKDLVTCQTFSHFLPTFFYRWVTLDHFLILEMEGGIGKGERSTNNTTGMRRVLSLIRQWETVSSQKTG